MIRPTTTPALIIAKLITTIVNVLMLCDDTISTQKQADDIIVAVEVTCMNVFMQSFV